MNKREVELRHRQTMAEGERANRLLKDPLIDEILEGEKAAILEKLGGSDIDTESEHELVLYLKAVNRFENQLKKKIKNGNKAQTLLEKLLQR